MTPIVPSAPDDRPASGRKSVLITGAGRRIGRAIALDLAAQGWDVAVHHFRSADDARTVVTEIRDEGGRAVTVAADLTDTAAVDALIAKAVAALGPLTCLINNASVFEHDRIDTVDRTSWSRHLDTNLWAPLRLTQAFAAQCPSGHNGCVINILDQRVWNLTPDFLSYTVSKTGLWTLTRTLALALAPHIRVNGIGPGPTLPSARQSSPHFEQQWRNVPLERPTPMVEICAAVRFLLEAGSMTGQMIALDGGEHLGWAQPRRGFVAQE